MTRYAKLINGQLHYATNFEKIGDNWVSNPTEEQLKAAGYKTLTYKEVDEIINQYEETETEIIVFTQKYIPNNNEQVFQSPEIGANKIKVKQSISTETVESTEKVTKTKEIKSMNKFKTFINNLGSYLTKLQIKIVSLIDKDSLWHDYLGSWIMLVMFGYCILFKVDIYLIPISVVLAGISKECIDKYIRKVKPQLKDFIHTIAKGLVLYILLLLWDKV